jgi:hypothetical protein
MLEDYGNVILVRVTADHGEKVETEADGDKKLGGYLHRYTATVVRTYKGRFKVGERVAFVEGYCPCGGERKVTTNSFVGFLMFLLVEDNVQTDAEFGIDPVDTDEYEPMTDRLFTSIFRGGETQQRGL